MIPATKDDHPARILVVGRTGVGKSSVINSVVGSRVAQVGKFVPTTAELRIYKAIYRGSSMILIDTPGFCDAPRNESNDDRYLTEIERQAGELDLILFVSKLDDQRVESSEYDTLEALTSRFSAAVWDRAVVVLTRADRSEPSEYLDDLTQRSIALREGMQRVIGDRAQELPFVPISNSRLCNPDGKIWMTSLWLAMLSRMSQHGFDSFVLSTITLVVAEAGADLANNGDENEASDDGAFPIDGQEEDDTFPIDGQEEDDTFLTDGQEEEDDTFLTDRNEEEDNTFLTDQGDEDIDERLPQGRHRYQDPTPGRQLAYAPYQSTYYRPNDAIALPPPVGYAQGNSQLAAPAAIWTPAPPLPDPQSMTTSSYVSNDVRVRKTVVNVGRGIGDITLNAEQIHNTQIVIENRGSSGLLDAVKAIGGWIAKKILHLFH